MHILDIVDIDNMVSELDETTLTRIGQDVIDEYEVDKDSMKSWLDRNALALKLTNLDPEEVTSPWPGAANTKLPLVLNAAMKASAEEYSEILRGDSIVKAEILGKHTDEKIERAERVKERMNYQFYHELEDWAEDHDKLILSKNIIGTVHKKVLYTDGKIQSVLRRNGVVINDSVEKTQEAPRVTDELDRFWWQVQEKVNAEEWEEIDLTTIDDTDFAEKDKSNRFLEQIRREDLDGDGYPEPYTVTVHERTKQVVRITPNYTPESITFNEDIDVLEYADLPEESKEIVKSSLNVIRIDGNIARVKYIKYSMLHSYEGGYWDFGYGILLGPLNENCNTLINQLLNQGHLQAKGGGFINSGIKMGSGELKFRNNEWKKVQSSGMDLSRNIVPLPVREPSQTLFSLLGLLMDVLREFSSVTEVMSGEQPRANMAASSIDMLIEQGKKMFNSVYKRHYRALSKEQKAVFDLNFLYQDPNQYAEINDIPPEQGLELARSDFSREGLDVLPTSNPEFSSKMRRIAEAQAMAEHKDDPRVNGSEVLRRYFLAILDDHETVETLVPAEPMVTPEQAQEQAEQQLQEFKDSMEARIKEAQAKLAETQLQHAELKAQIDADKAPLDLKEKQAELDLETVVTSNKAKISEDEVTIKQLEVELGKVKLTQAQRTE